jgi:hypothetical protein
LNKHGGEGFNEQPTRVEVVHFDPKNNFVSYDGDSVLSHQDHQQVNDLIDHVKSLPHEE